MVNTDICSPAIHWQQEGWISGLDLAFAQILYQGESQYQDLIALTGAHVSNQLAEQHVCVELSEIYLCLDARNALPRNVENLSQFSDVLQQSKGIGDGQTNTLMVLDNQHLYLHRYWQYEVALARMISQRAAIQWQMDPDEMTGLLGQLFDDREPEVNWQKVAVCVAAQQGFSLITGGPGTGKTTTVTKLMALVQSLNRAKGKMLDIRLVAPTGKAAARLTESIVGARQSLPEQLQEGIPDQCSTIHRLLGVRPHSPYFRHDENNQLHLDMLILDEASMVDLPLMNKLLRALPDRCRLVLLGDKEQLASVEVGNVLGDICANVDIQCQYSPSQVAWLHHITGYALPVAENLASGVSDNLVTLRKSHRFKSDSGVGQLASLVNQGKSRQLLTLLSNKSQKDVYWCDQPNLRDLFSYVIPGLQRYFTAVKQGNISLAFELLSGQQVLCASRKGVWGVENLNQQLTLELSRQGLISKSDGAYPGKPLMITENEHNLQLFNGDMGILMPDPAQPALLKAWFINSEGQLISFLPGRLPAHEVVYAMTIHKSQGSEFKQVFLCIDARQSRLLNRELIYTGITRARQQVFIYCEQQALLAGIHNRSKRGSGLARRLSLAESD